MKEKRKLKLKKFYFHPVTVFLFLTAITVIASGILSAVEMQATYNVVNANTKELEPTLVTVENLLSYDGIKFMISNAAVNFLSFGPLGMLLISRANSTFFKTSTCCNKLNDWKIIAIFLLLAIAALTIC